MTSLLLRALLCLSLLLNGTGYADAYAHGMAAGHGDASGALASSGCHDAEDATAHHVPPPPDCHSATTGNCANAGSTTHEGSVDDDCCAGMGGCQCSALQPLPALTAAWLPVLPVRKAGTPAASHAGRASPDLPRINRPPIA